MNELEKFRQAALNKGLYVASKTDIPKLVEASVDGYGCEYSLCQWFDQGGDGTALENREMHPKGWKSTWKANIADAFDQSIVIADCSEVNALLMWIKPHFKEASNLDWFLCGGLASLFHMGIKEMTRFDTYERYCHAQRHKYGSDSFYGNNLVVRKSSQGKGLGTYLLQSSLDILDSMGLSAYLETHTTHNVQFYQKFGFKVMCDDPIPGTKLNHYAMRYDKSHPEFKQETQSVMI